MPGFRAVLHTRTRRTPGAGNHMTAASQNNVRIHMLHCVRALPKSRTLAISATGDLCAFLESSEKHYDNNGAVDNIFSADIL